MTMMNIQINGNHSVVKAGKNLLETCMALGFNVPYFCYHPALGSVGACRQCAVKKFANAEDKKGKIIMSCMEPVTEGLIISIDDPEAKEFRAAVVEGLMTNHPHDCPICDEGGECHLQDMTVMTGHNYRRYEFNKRTHLNQDLGPLVHHEMNRCIQCYRCVRFYRDYAGGKDLNVFGSARQVYFGRMQEGTLESEFSGNLVEVCPTGVFTDKTLKKHFTRKWDLTNAPSLCVHCSLGCNTIVGERYGTVRRIMSRYNGDINGYFLCDKGRYGYEFINSPGRIKKTLVRHERKGVLKEADPVHGWKELLSGKNIMGIGSPRASLEANFALLTLAGKENFFHGVPEIEFELVRKAVGLLRHLPANFPTLKEMEQSDAVFILGEDITQTAPMMALAIRQTTRNKAIEYAGNMGIPQWNASATRELARDLKNPLYIATSFTTKLDDIASETWHAAPADIARLGFAVASAIDPAAPKIQDMDHATRELAGRIAEALLKAKKPLLITGIAGGNEDILNSVQNIATALLQKGKEPGIGIAFPESNSVGLALMDGSHLDNAFERISEGSVDTLIVLENDLYRRIPKEKADQLFGLCKQVIVMDHLMNSTAEKADMVLPAATYAESSGTMVNNEGRPQRYYSVLPENSPGKDSWRWIADMIRTSGNNSGLVWDKFDDVVNTLVLSYPVFAGIENLLPNAGLRVYNEKIARQMARFSGRTALNAGLSVNEPKPPEDPDSPMNFSMEGYKGNPPANLIPNYWSPGFNSVQAVNKYLSEPNGSLKNTGPAFRLFDKMNKQQPEYIRSLPEPFIQSDKELLILPVFTIFGSEELSAHAEAIGGLLPQPFLLLNARETGKIPPKSNNMVRLTVSHTDIDVQIKTDNLIPDGVAGLSFLPSRMPHFVLPGWGRIFMDRVIED
jgi:NADH-quinone oxidoreductase subunit G